MDQWDQYATRSWHRMLPPRNLDQILSGECDSILIEEDGSGFWLSNPYAQGQDRHDALEAAKQAGDGTVDRLWAETPSRMLAQAGLDGDAWSFEQKDGTAAFVSTTDARLAIVLVRKGEWLAIAGDEDVGSHSSAAEAAACFPSAPAPK